jgi:hypothetical protein
MMDLPVRVFVLEHVHVHDDGEEDYKLIGVYSTREGAQQAIDRLKLKPGFCDGPEGFSINAHVLDEGSWTSGYVTVLGSGNSETSDD